MHAGTQSWTVLRATPRITAISRLLVPLPASRSICRNCRMVSLLFAGIKLSSCTGRLDAKVADPRGIFRAGNRPVFDWNRGRLQIGIRNQLFQLAQACSAGSVHRNRIAGMAGRKDYDPDKTNFAEFNKAVDRLAAKWARKSPKSLKVPQSAALAGCIRLGPVPVLRPNPRSARLWPTSQMV